MIPFIARVLRLLRIGVSDVIRQVGMVAKPLCQGVQNSCNPVFMEVGARLGVGGMFRGMRQLGILSKTNIDVPGEASTIMHQQKNVGAVELATMSFGQSFQLSPIRLLTSVSAVINGGHSIVPHFGVSIENTSNGSVRKLSYPQEKKIVSKETSENMKMILEQRGKQSDRVRKLPSKDIRSVPKQEPQKSFRAAVAKTLHPVLDVCPGRRSEGFDSRFDR